MPRRCLYAKIVVTIILGIFGWIIGYRFNNARDQKSKRREIITEHLIEAYRVLSQDISFRPETEQRFDKLEKIISDIQLFGSNEQVKLAKKLADDVATGGEFQLDPLINNLRDNLRNELQLEPVSGNVKWLRITK